MEFLTLLPYIWGIGGIVLIIAEFVLPGFVIFFFGVGALLNALLLVLIPSLKNNLLLQIILWLASSGLLLFSLRRFFSKVFKGRTVATRFDYAGQKAEVIEEITPEKPGRIRFQGTSWKAMSYDEHLQVGDSVNILSKEDLTLYVTRSLLDEPE